MTANIRNLVVFFFLLMGLVPFLLMTDLFPFMRFGMFAETVRSMPQRELFAVTVQTPNGTELPLSQRQIGLDENHLNYLARTYYYKNQLSYFDEKLKSTGLISPRERLLIRRNTLSGSHWKSQVVWNR